MVRNDTGKVREERNYPSLCHSDPFSSYCKFLPSGSIFSRIKAGLFFWETIQGLINGINYRLHIAVSRQQLMLSISLLYQLFSIPFNLSQHFCWSRWLTWWVTQTPFREESKSLVTMTFSGHDYQTLLLPSTLSRAAGPCQKMPHWIIWLPSIFFPVPIV